MSLPSSQTSAQWIIIAAEVVGARDALAPVAAVTLGAHAAALRDRGRAVGRGGRRRVRWRRRSVHAVRRLRGLRGGELWARPRALVDAHRGERDLALDLGLLPALDLDQLSGFVREAVDQTSAVQPYRLALRASTT